MGTGWKNRRLDIRQQRKPLQRTCLRACAIKRGKGEAGSIRSVVPLRWFGPTVPYRTTVRYVVGTLCCKTGVATA